MVPYENQGLKMWGFFQLLKEVVISFSWLCGLLQIPTIISLVLVSFLLFLLNLLMSLWILRLTTCLPQVERPSCPWYPKFFTGRSSMLMV